MKSSRGKGAAKEKEVLKVADDRKVGKRKAAAPKPDKSVKKAKKVPAKKDPNKPKRPPSAFFVFLEEFRKTFKKNPNVKAVSAVGKAGGAKWKSLSNAEKAPYEAKAAKRKADYEKEMNAYNKKQETADDEEESDKSKSEINDEDNEESAEDEDGEDDEDEEDDD